MNKRSHDQAAPLACPLASSHDHRLSPWDKALWRITPGALALCGAALLSRAGGRS
jgi:hypothetical protein